MTLCHDWCYTYVRHIPSTDDEVDLCSSSLESIARHVCAVEINSQIMTDQFPGARFLLKRVDEMLGKMKTAKMILLHGAISNKQRMSSAMGKIVNWLYKYNQDGKEKIHQAITEFFSDMLETTPDAGESAPDTAAAAAKDADVP